MGCGLLWFMPDLWGANHAAEPMWLVRRHSGVGRRLLVQPDRRERPRDPNHVVDFFADFFLAVFLDFLRGTFAPALRASERPMAMACLRLFTALPDLPLFSVPRLRSWIA